MRTAKKTLCLALVLAMMLSLCVFANATVEKVEDYADYADIPEEYVQAATILTALEVFQGYEEDDSFHGDNLLTRAQGAKILAVLMGYKDSMANPNATPKFEDMVGHWAVPYVNYLADTGIIHGKSATVFDPDGPLTGTQFAKMLLTALGYDAEKEGLVGGGWDAKTARLALSADSYLIPDEATFGKFPWNENMNRFTAAQMAYTTLLLPLVTYSGDSSWKLVSDSNRTNQTISSAIINGTDAYMVEFAERYFPQLTRTTQSNDDFGVPSVTWNLNKKEITNYEMKPVWSTTEGVTGKDVKDQYTRYVLGNSTLEINEEVSVYVDGVKSGWRFDAEGNRIDFGFDDIAEDIVDGTKDDVTYDGTYVAVYVDDEAYTNNAGYDPGAVRRVQQVTVVIKHTWLSRATSDYKDGSVKLNVVDTFTNKHMGTIYTVKKGAIEDIKSGDDILVNIVDPFGWNGDPVVYAIQPSEVKTDTFVGGYDLTTKKFGLMPFITDEELLEIVRSSGIRMLDTVTIDGEDISLAEAAFTNSDILFQYDVTGLHGFTYDVYYDQYGYIIGIEYNTKDTNYVFITGYHAGGSNLGSGTYEVNAIWTDGTMDKNLVVTCSKGGSAEKVLSDKENKLIGNDEPGSPVLNAWFTSSKDKSGNVTLHEVVGATGKVLQASTVMSGMRDKGNKSDDISVGNNKFATGDDTYALSNDATVFILAKVNDEVEGGAISGVTGTVKGYKNLSTNVVDLSVYDNFANAVTKANFFKIIGNREAASDTYFIYDTSNKDFILYAVTVPVSKGGDLIYLTRTQFKEWVDEDGVYFGSIEAITNGEKQVLTVNMNEVGTPKLRQLSRQNMYEVIYDENGIITDIVPYDADNNILEYQETFAFKLADQKEDGYFVRWRLTTENEAGDTYTVKYDANVLYITPNGSENPAENTQELHLAKDYDVFVGNTDAVKNKDYDECGDMAEAIAVATNKGNEVDAIYADLNADGLATSVVIVYKEAETK